MGVMNYKFNLSKVKLKQINTDTHNTHLLTYTNTPVVEKSEH